MKDIQYWIWLSMLNLCPERAKKYLKNHSLETLWNSKEEELYKIFKKEETERILDLKYRQNLSLHEEYIKKYGIKLITIKDAIYPKKLKDINNAPLVFYAIGNFKLLKEKSIAIVGARKCSDYGKTVAQAFAYSLSKKDYTIVSGLALGIDKASHEGALIAKGKTIAIVGTGLDIIYPKENKNLFYDIIRNNGLVLSEFPLGTKPDKYNFPKRNRIISAISDGVLVVEASKKSGSLITVEFALEQGKEIFAIPRKHSK